MSEAFNATAHPIDRPIIRTSYSSLFVVSARTKEDTWSAQRIGAPVWKAWKGVWV